jgi:hypothetical protein
MTAHRGWAGLSAIFDGGRKAIRRALGLLALMLLAPVGGSSGVLRGSRGITATLNISNLLILQPAQTNSSPVRSAI